MIGLFVNTQVLRTQLDGRATIADFIASVHAATIEAQENQDLPFERLLEVLQPKRSLSQNPLFQVLYNHQRRRASDNSLGLTGLQIEKIEPNVDTVKFDLALDSEEGPSGEIRAIFTYATALFDAATIERLAAHWITLLRTMAQNSSQSIAGIALLCEQELTQIRSWNGADAGSATPFTPVHQTVARFAAQTPDAPALVFGDDVISYDELNRRANRLAHRLIRLGVTSSDLVGPVGATFAISRRGAAGRVEDGRRLSAARSRPSRQAAARHHARRRRAFCADGCGR